LAYAPDHRHGSNLGTRETQADLGQTVAEIFGTQIPHGASFLDMVAAH